MLFRQLGACVFRCLNLGRSGRASRRAVEGFGVTGRAGSVHSGLRDGTSTLAAVPDRLSSRLLVKCQALVQPARKDKAEFRFKNKPMSLDGRHD